MRVRHLIIAAALTFGLGGAAGASPLAGAAASVEAPGAAVELAGWKSRGRHYGWHRGRHLGWYRSHRPRFVYGYPRRHSYRSYYRPRRVVHYGYYGYPRRHYGWRRSYYRW